MQSGPSDRRRRRRYGPGPWWPPWFDPRFGPPPDVIYPGYQPWDPYRPAMTGRQEDEIATLERELEELEDEKVEIERNIEDVRKEISRRKRESATRSDIA